MGRQRRNREKKRERTADIVASKGLEFRQWTGDGLRNIFTYTRVWGNNFEQWSKGSVISCYYMRDRMHKRNRVV